MVKKLSVVFMLKANRNVVIFTIFSITAIILHLISNDFVESFKFSGSPKAVKKTWTLHDSRNFFAWIFPKNKESKLSPLNSQNQW